MEKWIDDFHKQYNQYGLFYFYSKNYYYFKTYFKTAPITSHNFYIFYKTKLADNKFKYWDLYSKSLKFETIYRCFRNLKWYHIKILHFARWSSRKNVKIFLSKIFWMYLFVSVQLKGKIKYTYLTCIFMDTCTLWCFDYV